MIDLCGPNKRETRNFSPFNEDAFAAHDYSAPVLVFIIFREIYLILIQ